MKYLAYVWVTMIAFGCGQPSAQVISEPVAGEEATSPSGLPNNISEFINEMNRDLNASEEHPVSARLEAVEVDGEYIVLLNALATIPEDDRDPTFGPRIASAMIIDSVAKEASASSLFAGMKWDLSINQMRFVGDVGFPFTDQSVVRNKILNQP